MCPGSGELAGQARLHLVHHRVHRLDFGKAQPVRLERSFQPHQPIEQMLCFVHQSLCLGGRRATTKGSLLLHLPSERLRPRNWCSESSPAKNAFWLSNQAIECISRVVTRKDSHDMSIRISSCCATPCCSAVSSK